HKNTTNFRNNHPLQKPRDKAAKAGNPTPRQRRSVRRGFMKSIYQQAVATAYVISDFTHRWGSSFLGNVS
ncbi:hypothetical protein CDAR_255401, partial [Caerostris darwini]